MSSYTQHKERNPEATVWAGNLAPEVDEDLLCELMLQAGPIISVHMPKDKILGGHQGYAFIEYRSPVDAEYAIRILNMVKVFGKAIRVNKAQKDAAEERITANLFIGHLDTTVDEKLLYDTFSQFGTVVSANVKVSQNNPERCFGFVKFETFSAADTAIASMDGQYLGGNPITVSYAFKKDGAAGEKHGSQAERLLAENLRAKMKSIPERLKTPVVQQPHHQQHQLPNYMQQAPPPPQPRQYHYGAPMHVSAGVSSRLAPPPPPPPPPAMHGYGYAAPPPPPPPPGAAAYGYGQRAAHSHPPRAPPPPPPPPTTGYGYGYAPPPRAPPAGPRR
jgi:splicing factor 3B subunit 4